MKQFDAVIIGGGFYGCCVAVFLRRRLGSVRLVEREPELLMRASRVNQARLHNGYHYPRSFLTAKRSHENLEVFKRHFPEGVSEGFRHIYGLARDESKVGRRHFERVFGALGLPLRATPERLTALFDPRLVEAVYEVDEPAFDVNGLRTSLRRQIQAAAVDISCGVEVVRVVPSEGWSLVELSNGDTLRARWVFNCTYASLNQIGGTSRSDPVALAHQVTEVALVELPDALKGLAITVMDGPFFSTMPFPSEGLHSLTHVRYTPHVKWREADRPDTDPSDVLQAYPRASRFPWMIRDARRFLPALGEARHVKSLYDIKTLPVGTQTDDARPILFHRDAANDRLISILGSKIDNIFDVYTFIEQELEL